MGRHTNSRLVLQRFDARTNTWKYVEDVLINGAGNKCRTMAKKTGVPHRVWDVTLNNLFCEC